MIIFLKLIFITFIESEEDPIDVKPKKRQKSKVVQSLKLKYKKEENPKCCKDEQELCVETGKSIVHVTNEELKSSEMVFFCIPKAESSVKITPKKQLNVDIKENAILKDCENINQIKPESLDNINSDIFEKSMEIKTEVFSDKNNVIDVLKEIKKELHILPLPVTIDIVPEVDIKYEQNQISNQIKIEFTNNITNSDFSETCNQLDNIHHKSLEESNKVKTKKELDEDLNISSLNKRQCDQNTSTQLSDSNLLATTSDIDKTLLHENVTIKSETIDNLSECYVHAKDKQDNNESEKQLINKWTIDEDKIILQTCKRVEDIEVLLETINRRIPQRSVSEVRLFLCILTVI